MEGKNKRGRPRRGWKNEVEEGLNIMGIKTGTKCSETDGNGGCNVVIAKVHSGV
jgi:hypothetical protein